MKKCSKCKEIKDDSEFCKDKSRKDGLSYCCKECAKQNSIDNKEKIAKYHKQHYLDNKEKRRRYCIDNKEKIKQYYTKYNINNKEKQKKQKKQYRNTFDGWFFHNWSDINGRTSNGTHPKYKSKQAMSYIRRGIEVRVTKAGLYNWCYAQKLKINIMLKQGAIVKGLKPSIDRIDSNGHYELSNLQILTVTENKKKR